MAKELTFLCARCKKEHPVSSIAFSMSDEMYKEITTALAPLKNRQLNEAVSKNLHRIKCITAEDLDLHLENKVQHGATVSGLLRLDLNWLKLRLENCGVSVHLEHSDLTHVLYTAQLRFEYRDVDGYLVPVKISDIENHPISEQRRCSRCGKILCKATGTAPEIRVVLQGSSRAGKTSCMIAMIDELLQHGAYNKTGISVNSLDSGKDEQLAWLEYELKCYRAGYRVEKTDDDQTEPGVFSVPLIIDKKNLVLTMVDMPGEYFDGKSKLVLDSNWFAQYSDLYTHCDAIWTSMQYHMAVSEEMNEERIKKITAVTGTTKEIIDKATYHKYNLRFSEIKDCCKNNGWKLPPHAIILSKTDSIAELMDENPQIWEAPLARNYIFEKYSAPVSVDSRGFQTRQLSPSVQNFNRVVHCPEGQNRTVYFEEQAYAISSRVREYFASINENMVNMFLDFNPRHSYFAMSAYGNVPAVRPADKASDEGDGTVVAEDIPFKFTPHPYNVCLPLLWTLAVSGRLPIAYKVATFRKRNFLETLRMGGPGLVKVNSQMSIVDNVDAADDACRNNLFLNAPKYTAHKIVNG